MKIFCEYIIYKIIRPYCLFRRIGIAIERGWYSRFRQQNQLVKWLERNSFDRKYDQLELGIRRINYFLRTLPKHVLGFQRINGYLFLLRHFILICFCYSWRCIKTTFWNWIFGNLKYTNYIPSRLLRYRCIFITNQYLTNYVKYDLINHMMVTYNKHCEAIDFTMSKNKL